MADRAGARPYRRAQPLRRGPRDREASLTGTVPVGIRATGWGWRHSARVAWAIEGLDLVVEPGERVLLLGRSGAGKSTLLKAIAGVLGVDEGESRGELHVDGRVGLLLQDPDSQVILEKVGDDVAFGAENLGVPRDEIWARVHESLTAVGLDVPLDRRTNALSGGQKQRLALAGVLAMRPGLILLDEPTANLDPAGVLEVRDAVGRVADRTGATLVVIEHRVAVWQDLVDRVVVLGPEGVIADGTRDLVQARGAELAAAGIWVPGFPPVVPVRHPQPSETLLEAHDLSVGRGKVAVREHLEVTVGSGRAVAITGANGSGKSTLGLTLGGLRAPVGGEVVAAPALAGGAGGHPIGWRSRELLTRIGTVFQVPEHQFLAATVRAELEVGPRALKLSRPEIDARVGDLLERLRLVTLAEANPFTLSGGEQRRLSVATALATRPRMLVLDEPTFGQDCVTWAELVRLMADLLDEGTAIVAASHDLDFVAALADEVVEL